MRGLEPGWERHGLGLFAVCSCVGVGGPLGVVGALPDGLRPSPVSNQHPPPPPLRLGPAVNRAQTLLPYAGTRPSLAARVFVAPSANVIGDVRIGESSSVWYGATLRGDVGRITIGAHTNIQDNALVHVARHNAAGHEHDTEIGDHVTVGHGAIIHAATIEDCVVVGMGSTVMDGARIESGAILAAGSLLSPGTVVPSGQIWAGIPARYLRDLAPGESEFLQAAAEEYAELAAVHAEENAKGFNAVELDKARREDRVHREAGYDEQLGVERDPETREITNITPSA